MIIKTDTDGKKAIEGLCDIALKVGGLQNINGVLEVLKSIEEIKPEEKKDGKK